MPNPISGRRQALAFKHASAWGTAVACGANDGVLFLSGQAGREASVEVDKSRGKAFSVDGWPGPIAANSSYKFVLRYAGFNALIAHFMGIAGVPAQQGATAAYKHTYKFSPDIYGLFGTLAKNMINYIEEIPTATVAGISLSGEVGSNPLELTVDLVGINRETGSLVNTLATFADVTLPDGADALPVMFSHLQFRMNDRDDVALAGGHIIYPSKFALNLKRKVKGEHTGEYRTSGPNPQDLIDQPSYDGQPELSLTLDFAKHTDTTYLSALGEDTRKKMDITATGPVIEGIYSYQEKWSLPHLQLKNAKPTDEDGRIKEPLEFIIHGASAAPAGMVGITDPLWWEEINKLATDPLA